MHFFSSPLAVAFIAFTLGSTALPSPNIQASLAVRDRLNERAVNGDRADAVKAAFTAAWDGYYKYCFKHDELHPVSNTCGDSRYVKQSFTKVPSSS